MELGTARCALIGDLRTAALVDRSGSIEWWCAPRFDSPAVFASLVGSDVNGFWRLSASDKARSRRRYRGDSLVLETTFDHAGGAARLIDFMPRNATHPTIVRIVEAVAGSTEFEMDLVPRMQYGRLTPRSEGCSHRWSAARGDEALELASSAQLIDAGGACRSRFVVHPNQCAWFVLQWLPSGASAAPIDAKAVLEETTAWWNGWSRGIRYDGVCREAVMRSALTLKALCYEESGAIVAAATASLPEDIGGDKNWDYRYCWLRDASIAGSSLLRLGLTDEASRLRAWLLRVLDAEPSQFDIMYGVGSERLSDETTLPWLSGFANSLPVRVGNGARDQLQLGVLGHVMRFFADAARAGLPFGRTEWDRIRRIGPYLEQCWTRKDNGIWETRGGNRDYVYSKVMVWSALRDLDVLAPVSGAPAERGRYAGAREAIRRQVLDAGFDAERSTFTQYYGSQELDASALAIPLRGFLDVRDPHVQGTILAIERHLMRDGLVFRYTRDVRSADKRRFEGEGAFTMCGFWLVQAWADSGRAREAYDLFRRLVATGNDVGLLSEEYDVERREPVGNVPQAFSHAGLIDAACAVTAALRREHGPGAAADLATGSAC